MILLIDNYDSFTYNLYQYFGELHPDILVKRNDAISVNQITQMKPEAIVLSPGPGHPNDAGACIEIIRSFYKTTPMLGICLGHQAIGAAFGAKIIQAKSIKHGKTSKVNHIGTGLFKNINKPIEVMRYHSLVIDRNTLPADFEITATSFEDHEIMGIKHKSYPLYGLQFHPESIGTVNGMAFIKNFIAFVRKESVNDEKLFTNTYKG